MFEFWLQIGNFIVLLLTCGTITCSSTTSKQIEILLEHLEQNLKTFKNFLQHLEHLEFLKHQDSKEWVTKCSNHCFTPAISTVLNIRHEQDSSDVIVNLVNKKTGSVEWCKSKTKSILTIYFSLREFSFFQSLHEPNNSLKT